MLENRLSGNIILRKHIPLLVDWVLEWFPARDWPKFIYITETSGGLSGRAYWNESKLKVCVGRAHHFPMTQQYPNRSDAFPRYLIDDPIECFVNVFAHEMCHFKRTHLGSDKRQRSELKGEREALSILKEFRHQREMILSGERPALVHYPEQMHEAIISTNCGCRKNPR